MIRLQKYKLWHVPKRGSLIEIHVGELAKVITCFHTEFSSETGPARAHLDLAVESLPQERAGPNFADLFNILKSITLAHCELMGYPRKEVEMENTEEHPDYACKACEWQGDERMDKIRKLKGKPSYEQLLHEYEMTRGLWCLDQNPETVSVDWIRENAFRLPATFEEKDND